MKQREKNAIDAELIRQLQQKMEWELRLHRNLEKEEMSDFLDRILHAKKRFWENQDVETQQFLEAAWALIEKEAERLRQEEAQLIAYQGEMGAYGEMAASSLSPIGKIVSCERFEDVFEGVKNGLYDLGVVPVENSTGGMVDAVNQLLWRYAPKIIGAIIQPIQHYLLGQPNISKREIEKVFSHSQALRQCRKFIEKEGFEPIAVSNTATAARLVAEENDIHLGAIASKNAAVVYGLDVIVEKIEDAPMNQTRFLIIAAKENNTVKSLLTGGQWKCSVAFELPDVPGSLFRVLEIAYGENISLTRLDSIACEPGKYFFFLDFNGRKASSVENEFLSWLQEYSQNFKFLGCYPEMMGTSV